MPKNWGKQIFAHGRFPEVGEKQKTERKEREKRAKVGNNNGQAMHGARKPPGQICQPISMFKFIKKCQRVVNGLTIRGDFHKS